MNDAAARIRETRLAPWRRSAIRCAMCTRRDVHPTVRMRFRVIFSRSGSADIYCSRCAADVCYARREWSFCPLPRAVRS